MVVRFTADGRNADIENCLVLASGAFADAVLVVDDATSPAHLWAYKPVMRWLSAERVIRPSEVCRLCWRVLGDFYPMEYL